MFSNKKNQVLDRTKKNYDSHIILKGWPEVLVFVFIGVFIIQLILLIILNAR